MVGRSFAVAAVVLGAAGLAPLAAQAACHKPWAAWKAAPATPGQLDELLADAGCSDDLLAYAREGYNGENILFLRAVAGGQDKKAIYNKYIAPNAPSSINIAGPTRAALTAVAVRGNWERLNFTQAVAEIRALVLRDTLIRYYNSKP